MAEKLEAVHVLECAALSPTTSWRYKAVRQKFHFPQYYDTLNSVKLKRPQTMGSVLFTSSDVKLKK